MTSIKPKTMAKAVRAIYRKASQKGTFVPYPKARALALEKLSKK